jgi:serine/threonine protein kinase
MKKNGLRLDPHSILEIDFSDLKLAEQISMGGFSVIHKGQYKGLEVAVKKVFNPNITEELLAEMGNEVNMLAKFRHPNIVLMIGICSLPPNLCIAMEYIPGSLHDLLYKQKVELKDTDRAYLVRQIVSTIYYLHSHSIVHRDIKSHNFLVGDKFLLKLCDFGLAKHNVHEY